LALLLIFSPKQGCRKQARHHCVDCSGVFSKLSGRGEFCKSRAFSGEPAQAALGRRGSLDCGGERLLIALAALRELLLLGFPLAAPRSDSAVLLRATDFASALFELSAAYGNKILRWGAENSHQPFRVLNPAPIFGRVIDNAHFSDFNGIRNDIREAGGPLNGNFNRGLHKNLLPA
jgi:hypothetical protein